VNRGPTAEVVGPRYLFRVIICLSARHTIVALALASMAVSIAGCTSSSADDGTDSSPTDAVSGATSAAAVTAASAVSPTPASTTASARIPLPPIAAQADYQLGGAYTPPSGVRIVSRDSSASPVHGIYNICYINAFQAQPDATDWWRQQHPGLLLHGTDGALVIDQDWSEALLDVSNDAKRAELATVEYGWIDSCAGKGFQAIEADNLDSYTRSDGLLTADENAAFATLLAARAHHDGMAIAQKNSTDLLPRHGQIGFDFAVAEQCGVYGECDGYAAAYADHVLDVEYTDAGLAAACKGWSGRISIVERDLDVSAQGTDGYVYKTC
jgi:hypothetical protein